MNSPLSSVVIPTYCRPGYLARAIESVFSCQGGETEIIIVPNGADTSWKQATAQWKGDERIVVSPIAQANGNTARNHGLSIARGKYLRFLDDDDYLLPDAKLQQIKLEQTQADICVGGINIIASTEKLIATRAAPEAADFVESILMSGHLTLPHAYLYRRSAIAGIRWDEKIRLAQDKHWLYGLCESRDYSLTRVPKTVGVWCHHAGSHVSVGTNMETQAKAWVTMLLDSVSQIKNANRLGQARSQAAHLHLWKLIFNNYFYDPAYWEQIMHRAQQEFPEWQPDRSLYKYDPTGKLSAKTYLRAVTPLKHAKRLINLTRIRAGILYPVIKP